jgi:DNA-binding NarL/FixJ family response regulator
MTTPAGDDVAVVVVDDQELVRAGLASLLDGADGIRVVGRAGNGEEGVRLIRATHPDVALIDVRMPVLNGLEAIEQVRRDADCAGTRLVVLTTFGLDEYVYGAIRAGADGFLLKDAEPDDLVRSVRLVAQGDAVISPAVTRTLIDDYLRQPPSQPVRTPPPLTDREHDILDGICRGLSNRQIAAELIVGQATVKTYVSRLLEKFGTGSRVGLVVGAYESGLLGD